MNDDVFLAAAGGALIWYGISQRLKSKTTDDILTKSINQRDGWIGIGVGVLLVIASLV